MKKIMFNDKYGLTQAVLEERKAQTRRIITCPQTFKGRYVAGFHVYKRPSDGFISEICMYDEDERDFEGGQIVPKYKIGEIVAVAQSYKDCGGFIQEGTPRWNYISAIVGGKSAGWTNKMFVKPELMPHQIKITNVRIQRLQDISDDDCLAEGIERLPCGGGFKPFAFYDKSIKVKSEKEGINYGWYRDFDTPKEAYAALIDKVGKKGDWKSNPYVFVYDFELVK